MKCVCHEGTSILDGFSAIWFSFWIALNWIWNSLGLAFGLAFGSIVDYVLKDRTPLEINRQTQEGHREQYPEEIQFDRRHITLHFPHHRVFVDTDPSHQNLKR